MASRVVDIEKSHNKMVLTDLRNLHSLQIPAIISKSLYLLEQGYSEQKHHHR